MRRILNPVAFATLLLAAPFLAWSAAPNVQGNSFTLDAGGEATDVLLCGGDEELHILAVGTISAGDDIALQVYNDPGSAYTDLVTWTSADLPLSKIHICAGRSYQYKVLLTDADDSSDVDVHFWKVSRP